MEISRLPDTSNDCYDSFGEAINRLGYRNTHSFCGGLVRPGRDILEWDCDLVYQPF